MRFLSVRRMAASWLAISLIATGSGVVRAQTEAPVKVDKLSDVTQEKVQRAFRSLLEEKTARQIPVLDALKIRVLPERAVFPKPGTSAIGGARPTLVLGYAGPTPLSSEAQAALRGFVDQAFGQHLISGVAFTQLGDVEFVSDQVGGECNRTKPGDGLKTVVTPSPQGMVWASPQSVVCQPAAAWVEPTVVRASTVVQPPKVHREGLVVGRSADDWERLFNRGFESLRSGDDATAAEYFAASAALGDDPRAWTFLALAEIGIGDMTSARQAARYSAARLHENPGLDRQIGHLLTGIRGPARNALSGWQKEVSDESIVRATLAVKPRLFATTEALGDHRIVKIRP